MHKSHFWDDPIWKGMRKRSMKRDEVSMGGGFLVPKRYKTGVHMCMWKEGEKTVFVQAGIGQRSQRIRTKADLSQ